jgi:hypothetical protein
VCSPKATPSDKVTREDRTDSVGFLPVLMSVLRFYFAKFGHISKALDLVHLDRLGWLSTLVWLVEHTGLTDFLGVLTKHLGTIAREAFIRPSMGRVVLASTDHLGRLQSPQRRRKNNN